MKIAAVAALVLGVLPVLALGAGFDDLNAGIAAFNHGDAAQGIANFSKALAGDLTPDQQYVAYYDRARMRNSTSDLDGALADYNAALALRPGNKNVLKDRAFLHMYLMNLDAAQQDAEAYVAADPYSSDVYRVRALVSQLRGDAEKELQDFQLALSKEPQNVAIKLQIGIANFEAGHFEAAAAVFDDARAGKPGYAWLWLALADLRLNKAVPVSVPTRLQGSGWPQPLVDFYQGKSSEAEVIAVSQRETRAAAKFACETGVYLGEWHLAHGDREGGTALLEKSVGQCSTAFVEWFAAHAALRKGP